ncbi:MAG TPA: MEDS domain-containing protein [Candidatus Krumholzibacteria bacterium]|nr:MEDS domain-containing protein [Candidatus Krumholzibacteria bacterium]
MSTALLTEAPAGHFATLAQSTEALAKSASRFLEEGIRNGSPAVLIATESTRDYFLHHIQDAGFDVDELDKSGMLTIVDADTAIDRLMQYSAPDWDEFNRIVGNAVIRAGRASRQAPRVYGELVNLLWQTNRERAAIRIEEYWNKLARKHRFSLFCGYVIDCNDRAAYTGPLHEIGRTHCTVLASEDDTPFSCALERACGEVYGISVALLLKLSKSESVVGESRLPTSWRTLRWLMKSMPVSGESVFLRTLRYFRDREKQPI